MNEVITQQWGAFGAVFLLILAPLGAFALRQTLALTKSQEQRVEDAKAVAATVVTVIKDFSEAAREQVRSQTEQRAVSEDVIETLSRLDATFKRVEDRIGTLEASVGRIALSGGRPTTGR